jgi:quinol monooxygenase YgiN
MPLLPEEPMAASAVSMTVRWMVPLGESRSITDALHQVMVAARTSPGCLRCFVSSDVGQQVGLQYVEEWATEELLRREVNSDRFSTLARLMEHATALPVVEFALTDGTRGLDYVHEVRAAAAR